MKRDEDRPPESVELSSGGHALAAIGRETEKIVDELFKRKDFKGKSLFNLLSEEELKKLASAFSQNWSDAGAAKVVKAYSDALSKGREIDISSLQRWIWAQPDNAEKVIDCISVDPPPEISITKVLSEAGSQKLVFLAMWRLRQHEVVVKKLLGPPELVQRIIARESHSHPLSVKHDNIIDAHFLPNRSGEIFIVEEFLPNVLNDRTEFGGLTEASNLLYDISNALHYLYSKHGLVHGDVKPDNIGQSGSDYKLLDFGICQEVSAFSAEVTPTGSLRTRAPELLEEHRYVDPHKADVWALGATIFKVLINRYPLYNKGEVPPKITSMKERRKCEKLLLDRVRNQWEYFVDLSQIEEPLRRVLTGSLEKDPNNRCTASELMQEAERELSAFLRRTSEIGPFSPLDELEQLQKYLPDGNLSRLMPASQRLFMHERLKSLKEYRGMKDFQLRQIDELLQRMS